MSTIGNTIAQIAKSYNGQQEITPNNGFKDPTYGAKIAATGWEKNQPWCAAAAIVVWTEAYAAVNPALGAKAKHLYSLNSQRMAHNFHADPVWPTSTTVPTVGSMVIFAEGDSTLMGHTGIVIAVDADGITYHTEEGNTIPDGFTGNLREGFIVATHTHKVGMPHSATGLNLLRFIHPM